MDVLDFAESQGKLAAAFSLANLDLNRQRAHALLVLLLGGAGAMGGLAISQASNQWIFVAAWSMSLWWFACAAWLALRALRTQPIRSWAGEGWPLVEKAREFDHYVKQSAIEGVVLDTLTLLRETQLRKMQGAADEYRVASTIAAVALDQAYKAAALTPIVPALVLSLMWCMRYFG